MFFVLHHGWLAPLGSSARGPDRPHGINFSMPCAILGDEEHAPHGYSGAASLTSRFDLNAVNLVQRLLC